MKTPTRALAALLSFFIIHASFFVGRALAQTAGTPAQAAGTPAQAADAPAQNVTVTGRVFNVVTGYYVTNAEIRVEDTNFYVFTEDGGFYSIVVPAGKVKLVASYAGTQTATTTIDATPGGRNVADFDLRPIVVDTRVMPSGTSVALPGTEEIIMMDRFVVSDDRSGQAKAIMAQRAADNPITALAIDNFGDLTSGSIGEFLKYMPGVTVDYSEDEAETVRVGGLDPKYAGFSMDGVPMASAFGTSRASSFPQMSVTGIESIEFHHTLLARMPADTPAGKFDLRTKYAFNNKKPVLKFQIGLDGSTNALEFGRNYLPDDKKHWLVYPGGQISYGGAFLNRKLGIDATISRYANYRNNQTHYTYYSYLNPTNKDNKNDGVSFVERNGNLEMEEYPDIVRLQWREGPKIWTQEAANLNLDFRATSNLIFSLKNNFVVTTNEYYNSYYELRNYEPYNSSDLYLGPGQGTHPDSTLTKWIVDPVGPTGNMGRQGLFLNNSAFRRIKDTNYMISPRFEYKNGAFQVNFRSAYSRSVKAYRDLDAGFMRSTTTRLMGMGWIAERDSTNSHEWTLTRTAGTDWSQPQNFDRGDTYSQGTHSEPLTIKNTKTSADLDFTYALPIFRHPITLRAGVRYLFSDYNYSSEDNRYTYLGDEGRQMATTMLYTTNYVPNLKLGGNVNEQGWRVTDLFSLYENWRDHPDWFAVDRVNNARRNFLYNRALDERIESAYFEANTRAGRFAFNLGVRMEHTRTTIQMAKMRSWDEIDELKKKGSAEDIALGRYNYTTDQEGVTNMDTVEGFYLQYYDGKRFPRIKDYTNFFFSGGLKYDITKNLRFQLSASQAILRPDYDNLSRVINYSVYRRGDLVVPNPYLKPEQTLKTYASLTYYFNPAGSLEVSVYRIDIQNLQSHPDYPEIISKEQAEYQVGYPIQVNASLLGGGGDEGEEGGGGDEGGDEGEGDTDDAAIVFRSAINAEGTRIVYGATITYDQRLAFLPGVLKGISLFGSFTTASMKNAREDWEKVGRARTAGSGGIRYSYNRLNCRLSATWTDDRLESVAQAPDNRRVFHSDHLYIKARTTVDLSGSWRLNKNLELTVSIRNLTNAPLHVYSNVPDRLARWQIYGSVWNVAIRGTY